MLSLFTQLKGLITQNTPVRWKPCLIMKQSIHGSVSIYTFIILPFTLWKDFLFTGVSPHLTAYFICFLSFCGGRITEWAGRLLTVCNQLKVVITPPQ